MSLVTPEFGLLFWMVVIFGIVFFLLAKFGFPVITDMVDERSAKIAKSLKDADEIEARMAAWKEEQAKLVEETRRQQAAILKNATETKAKIVADAKVQAKAEADKILSEASQAADRGRKGERPARCAQGDCPSERTGGRKGPPERALRRRQPACLH